MKYRVLMQDTVNGQVFNFAMVYDSCNANCALDSSEAEFPNATFVSVIPVEQDLGELLKKALAQSKALAA
jgi:hypothetical protein